MSLTNDSELECVLLLHAYCRQIANKTIEDETDEVSVGLVPFFHSMGFMIMILSLIGGRKLVVVRRFNMKQLLQSIQDHKVSVI